MTQIRTRPTLAPSAPVVVTVPAAGGATSAPAARGAGGAEDVALTPGNLSRAAKGLFTRGPLVLRTMQHFRPYICPFEEVIRFVPRGSTVLDVGCGGGLFLGLLHETGVLDEGAEAGGTGFDCSAKAIGMATDMAQNARGGARLKFIRLDVAEPWPTGPGKGFDVVSIIDVMHHIPLEHHRSLLENASAALRPGGRLVYKDMTDFGWGGRSWRNIANRLHDLVMARQFIRHTPIETIERWARELGLEVVHSGRYNRLWYGHELLVLEKPAAAEAGGLAAPTGDRVGAAR